LIKSKKKAVKTTSSAVAGRNAIGKHKSNQRPKAKKETTEYKQGQTRASIASSSSFRIQTTIVSLTGLGRHTFERSKREIDDKNPKSGDSKKNPKRSIEI
jgi:hypothetical protein